MKLEKFQEKNKKNKGIIIGTCSVILLLTIVIVIRSFALYEEKKEFDVIKGRVPDQNYDVMFSFILEDENGNKTSIETIPEDKNYDVTISCNNGATGVWDYENWGPLIQNLTITRTKCKINFGPEKPTITDTIKNVPTVTSGDGLYEVSHADAEITYTSDETAIQNLKQTEYRYAGKSPNNYVKFNNELWRIIGLVNTPEGQRIKLIRNESFVNYAWDSSESSVNGGYGVNEWSQSKIMNLLNHGAYYNRTSGTCYNGPNNATKACDFSETGLTPDAKNMIDTVTWNLGSNNNSSYENLNTSNFYNLERSNHTGKICSSGQYCNDSVERTTTWIGSIGLMNPSDYGYATSGGSTTNRVACLNTFLYSWSNISDCVSNDWLSIEGANQWTLIPRTSSTSSYYVVIVGIHGNVGYDYLDIDSTFQPTTYLKESVKITSGNGSIDFPFELSG